MTIIIIKTKIFKILSIIKLASLNRKLSVKINIYNYPIKSKSHPVHSIPNHKKVSDKTLIKNSHFQPWKIATYKLNPNTSLIWTLNFHIQSNKYSNFNHKKSIVSMKNLEIISKKLMINLLNLSIKIWENSKRT